MNTKRQHPMTEELRYWLGKAIRCIGISGKARKIPAEVSDNLDTAVSRIVKAIGGEGLIEWERDAATGMLLSVGAPAVDEVLVSRFEKRREYAMRGLTTANNELHARVIKAYENLDSALFAATANK